jgi:flagellar biosynthetic protein FliR
MTGLHVVFAEQALSGFLLALARTAGFVLVAPPFNTRSVPVLARAGVALALALPLTAWTGPAAPPLVSAQLALWMPLQVLVGIALGFAVLVVVATIQTIGDLVDVVGGFSLSLAMDPLMLVQASVMGRLHQLIAITMLFVSDAHLLVLHGLARSVQLAPQPNVDAEVWARAAAADVAGLMLAAVQVAAPLMAVMLIADVALGLLTRAAPALNAFALAFPLKILLALLLAGLLITQLPPVLAAAAADAAARMLGLAGGG